MDNKIPNRSSFYIVILCMCFISAYLLIYAEDRAVFSEDEFDETDSIYSGFTTVEFSDLSPGSFLLTGKAHAGQLGNDDNFAVPNDTPPELDILLSLDDLFDSVMSAKDVLDILPNEIISLDLDPLDDELMLLERTDLWKEYVVQQKETLSDIVMKFSGVTVQDIVRANELKNPNQLKEKQMLLIPLQEEFIDDTLDEVRLRKARLAALKEAIVPLEIAPYIVKDGDSLWSIANSMNVEVDTLIGCNTIGNVLRPGAVLRVPNQDGIFHKFKSGDTVEKVSAIYKVQIDRIRKVNPTVDLNSLKPGSELFIPGGRIEAADTKDANENKKDKVSKADKKKQNAKQSGKTVIFEGGSGFKWPVVGKITSTFGWRRHPILRRADFHSAIDIKAPHGAPIKASRGGRVVYAGWMSGYGKAVVIEHSNGYSTLYGHCSSLEVNKGDNVSVNEVIARVGSTGRATGTHVHFELRSGNRPVNPLMYLK